MSNTCILCGKCMEVCPLLGATGREELAPRAKSDLCRMLAESSSALSEKDAAKLAGLCLGCKRCRDVCSQGVDVPALVAGLRNAHPNFKSWLWKTWLTRARQLWAPGSSAANLVPDRFRSEKFGTMLKMLAGLKGGPGLEPCVDITGYPDIWRGEKMLLFSGCTANYVQGRWLMAALKILDGLGVEVLPGDFTCCGGGLKAAGYTEDAAGMARKNIDVWEKAGRPRIVTFCMSCRAGLLGYSECFADEQDRHIWSESILSLSNGIHEPSFMLTDNAPKALGYHHPCHAGKDDPDRELVMALFDDRLVVSTDRECCGFGGIMRLAAPELTEPVNRTCWERLAGADTVVTGCSACSAQLSATAPDGVKVGHWLELIR